MKALAAPIIHARTKDIDFRSGLLTIPEHFNNSDVQWARKYILDSTRYFELAGEDGRWTAFCNEDVVVTGVSIYIENLYKKCNRQPCYAQVDGKRRNYPAERLVTAEPAHKRKPDYGEVTSERALQNNSTPVLLFGC